MADENRSRRKEKRQGSRRGATSTVIPERPKAIATQSEDHQHEKKQGIHSHIGATQHHDQQHGGVYSSEKKGTVGGQRQVDASRSRDLSVPFLAAESSFPKQDTSQRGDERATSVSQGGKRSDLLSDSKRPNRSEGKSVGVVKIMQKALPKKSKELATKAQQQQSKKKEAKNKASQFPSRQQSDRIASERREFANKVVGGVEPGKLKSQEGSEKELAEKEFIFRIPVESVSQTQYIM